MKKIVIGTSALFAILPSSIEAKRQTENSPLHPNIVFILVDDLGWNDLGCSGSQYYETPNVDRLCKQGVNFTNSYSACQVSSPSRASILTGKFPARHGVTNWIGELSGEAWRKMGRNTKLLPADYAHALSTNEITLPKALRQDGYVTFMAGKWHLGGDDSTPEMHGFDQSVGGYHAGSPYGGYFSPYSNPKLKDGPVGEELSMRLAKETTSFIRNHIKQKNAAPFFTMLSFYAVHGPIQTTETRWNYFRDKAERQGIAPKGYIIDRTLPVRQIQDNPIYAGLVAQMDDAVGYVMHELELMGLDKNTIVIFTSDNGGVSSGDDFSTSCLPLRGGKGRQWEGGTRVPLFIKYPGCKAASVVKQPVIATDLYPTILDIAKLPQLPAQHLDGVSLLPLLVGNSIPSRPFYWHYPHYGNQGGEPTSVIRDGDWKLIHYYEDDRDELYNLAIDSTESEVLNIQHPEKLRSLRSQLENWLNEVGAKRPQPDVLYNPRKETEYKNKQQSELLNSLENERKRVLQKGWQPNANWWKSKVTID